VDAGGESHGFTERNGAFTTIADPAGAEGTAPQGISNTGVVVGLYTDGSGSFHGFEFTPAR
jgi:probable HAF family extracellular repeat protein